MEDAAIVDLYWQRSDRAIAESERKYGAYCRRIAYNIVENLQDAEECVNDTYLAAWNAMPTQRPRVLRAWLGRVVRNIAVDRSALKDDRHSAEDAEQLYKDAEKLKHDLQTPFEIPEDNSVVAAPEPKKEKPREEPKYSGPSVLSYELEGRKASRLPIPAYRCIGAGEVRVNITVDRQGTVTGAKVDDGSSAADGCLRSFAVRAARMSKFSMSTTAPDRQQGYIIYQFVAQ